MDRNHTKTNHYDYRSVLYLEHLSVVTVIIDREYTQLISTALNDDIVVARELLSTTLLAHSSALRPLITTTLSSYPHHIVASSNFHGRCSTPIRRCYRPPCRHPNLISSSLLQNPKVFVLTVYIVSVVRNDRLLHRLGVTSKRFVVLHYQMFERALYRWFLSQLTWAS